MSNDEAKRAADAIPHAVMSQVSASERPDLREPVHAAWEANAAFWDERMGDGNFLQRVQTAPATERLLQLRPGERVVEIACGNGVMTRRLAQLGARVLATDVSAGLLERARARTVAMGLQDRVEYRQADATDEAQLVTLGAEIFDAAVCINALMDIPELGPLFAGVRQLLKPGGRFVCATMHPAFNSGPLRGTISEENVDGTLVMRYTTELPDYVTPSVAWGVGMRDQPEPLYHFHRPLSVLLGAAFRAGFVLDALEEPAFTPDGAALAEHAFTQEHVTGIPPVLAARLR